MVLIYNPVVLCTTIPQADEFYVCIYAERDGDVILFHHEGGVEVGDVDAKALRLKVPVEGSLDEDHVKQTLLVNVPPNRRE